MKNETSNFEVVLYKAGSVSAKTCIHIAINRLFPLVVAVTMATSGFAQNPAGSHQPTPATQKKGLAALPGERLTAAQRQALANFGPDVSVEFSDQEVPSAISGPLGNRNHLNDPAAEAQAALDRYGAAFRRGANDGFTFSSVERDKTGALNVLMTQTYKGLPVVGGQLTVQLSQTQVTGISGRFVADLDFPTESTAIPAQTVAATALSFAGQQGYPNVQAAARTHEPVVFLEGRSTPHVAIPVEVTHDAVDGNDQADIYVDAGNGQVLGARPMLTLGGGCPTGQICLPTATQLLQNPSFDLGDVYWGRTANVIEQWGASCFNGAWCAYLDGYSAPHHDNVSQTVTIPSNITSATLSFYAKIWTNAGYQYPIDLLAVQIRNVSCSIICVPGSTVLSTLATYTNVSAGSLPFSYGNWVRLQYDVTRFKGQTVAVYFQGDQNSSLGSSFMLDSVMVTVQ